MSPRILLPTVALALLSSACSMDRLAGLASPYRADVRQGNFQDPEAVARLEKGMTRDQVRFLLGTPLLVDPFRNDRWDYVYYVKRATARSSSGGSPCFSRTTCSCAWLAT